MMEAVTEAGKEKPMVGIIMGSISDWPTLQVAAEVLADLGLGFEARVVSAHRTPELLFDYAKGAAGRGFALPDRRSGRCGPPAGHGCGLDTVAGIGRAGAFTRAGWARFVVVHRADAGGNTGRDVPRRGGGSGGRGAVCRQAAADGGSLIFASEPRCGHRSTTALGDYDPLTCGEPEQSNSPKKRGCLVYHHQRLSALSAGTDGAVGACRESNVRTS